MELVGRKVEKRITEYARIKSTDPEKVELSRFNDSIAFGAADDDREQQIRRGIDYFRTERERQREVAARMAQHKIIDINSESSTY
jgi:hypothetical protein